MTTPKFHPKQTVFLTYDPDVMFTIEFIVYNPKDSEHEFLYVGIQHSNLTNHAPTRLPENVLTSNP